MAITTASQAMMKRKVSKPSKIDKPFEKVFIFDIGLAGGASRNVSSLVLTRQILFDKFYNVDKLVPFLTKLNDTDIIVVDNLMLMTVVFNRDGEEVYRSDDSTLFFMLDDMMYASITKLEWLTQRGYGEHVSHILPILRKLKANNVNIYTWDETDEAPKKYNKPEATLTLQEFNSRIDQYDKMLIRVLCKACKENLIGIFFNTDGNIFVLGLLIARVVDNKIITDVNIVPISLTEKNFNNLRNLLLSGRA